MVEMSYEALEGMKGREILDFLEICGFIHISYLDKGLLITRKDREEVDNGRC